MVNSRCSQYLIQGDLFLNIYLIGYASQGESVVFTVEDSTTIIYSGVVDCYKRKDDNFTKRLLEFLEVKNVDLICWTHPHLDHSLGLEEILDVYVSEQTRIVYPSNLLQFNEEEMNETVVNIVRKIKNLLICRKEKKSSIHAVSGNRTVYRSILKASVQSFEFLIQTLSPCDDIIEKRIVSGKEDYINEYSVSLLLSLGGTAFYLAGDIENSAISKIDDFSIPQVIDYLKIPHHASPTASKLIQWFSIENKVGVCCTTEYKSGGLPNPEVLNQYKKVANQIYITGENGNRTSHYGVICSKYDVYKNKISTRLAGDAFLFHHYENDRYIKI